MTAGGSVALAGVYGALPGLSAASGSTVGRERATGVDPNPLRRAPEVAPSGLTLVAAEGKAEIGGGVRAPGYLLNESLPSPLIRVHRGDAFNVTLRNELRDDLILHWHGLTPPEASDGHPRLAIRTGGTYAYGFTVEDRASTYWYHSHTHMKTGKHTALGIGGLLIVEDEEEASLGLPAGEREIPVILQDRQVNANGQPMYLNPNLTAGHMGSEPFGNGIHRPYLELESAVYRFRILNGSNARIFRMERSDGQPLVIIGNDGGLLEQPEAVGFVDLAPAERLDVLLDLRSMQVGDRLSLRSRAFTMPVGLDVMGGAGLQGMPMELLQLRVARRVQDGTRIPERFSRVTGPDPAAAVRERRFHFTSDRDPNTRSIHMRHRINGVHFEMDRVDERVPFGETEIWSFINDQNFAHPIHLHATHFRVLSRTGGRGQVFPWEGGLKDTVLVFPGETVRVAVRFSAHRGLFLLHCHNLEHEDVGMMLNIMVD